MKKILTNFVLYKKQKSESEQEGIAIRYKRSKKFRKSYRFITKSIQVLLVWYLILFSAIQLNSSTNAAFNDVEEIQASLHVKWPVDEWDKSSLDFAVASLERGGSCNPPKVFAEIFNSGEDMTFSTWTWELYQVGKGNQSKTPISPVLESGEVPMIPKDEKGMIETTQLQELPGNGTYRFKVIKPDRPGQDAIWSEKIEITDCPALEEESKQTEAEKLPAPDNDETNVEEPSNTSEEEATPEEQENASEESEESVVPENPSAENPDPESNVETENPSNEENNDGVPAENSSEQDTTGSESDAAN